MTNIQNDFQNQKVCIIGLGYVGLPLAVVIARTGMYSVVGIDINHEKVDQINRGSSYIEDVNSGDLVELRKNRSFYATVNFFEIKDASVAIVVVPTPLDEEKNPDLSSLINAIEEIAEHASSGLLIVVESTSYPGTTEELIAPYFTKKGLEIGKDIFLCFSPERTDPGRRDWTLENTPKVIGGATQSCLEKGSQFYASFVSQIIQVSNTRVAEMVKLLENSFRSINIGFINEMMILCEYLNLNIWEVIEAANTKPFGMMKFFPGPGIGGHCIPIDPLYLNWKLQKYNCSSQFIQLASQINSQMPKYWITKIFEGLKERQVEKIDAKVLILGITYKKNLSDLRESPAIEIFKLLRAGNIDVTFYDPLIESFVHEKTTFFVEKDPLVAIAKCNCAFIATDHDVFLSFPFDQFDCLIIDSRGVLQKQGKNLDPKKKEMELCSQI